MKKGKVFDSWATAEKYDARRGEFVERDIMSAFPDDYRYPFGMQRNRRALRSRHGSESFKNRHAAAGPLRPENGPRELEPRLAGQRPALHVAVCAGVARFQTGGYRLAGRRLDAVDEVEAVRRI